MQKQVAEMTNLSNLRRDRDYYIIEIQDIELRIQQLKKSLNVCSTPLFILQISDKVQALTQGIGSATQ
jgi:hypothetical protein